MTHDAIDRLEANLPAGWTFDGLVKTGHKFEVRVKGPTPPFITSLFARGDTPDDAVDAFLKDVHRLKPAP